ncbi:MAG: hypothetical protein ACKVZ6_11260 [Kineosporiaceae bacterium]|jgi:hypothetical protein
MSPWVPVTEGTRTDVLDDVDRWLLSDAWVLAAVRVTGTEDLPARLVDVIIAADAVNHLVLSRREIEHAVARLVPAGLIQVDTRGFAVTWYGRRIVALARGAAPERMAALLSLVATIDVAGEPWMLDEHEYQHACLEYRHTVFEGYRRETRNLRRFG